MAAVPVLDVNFEPVGEGALDKKNRVPVTRALRALRDLFGEDLSRLRFTIASNKAGQILLSPEASVPAHEAWLYKNPSALAKVRTGLAQATRGKLRDLGSFAKHAKDASDE